MEDEIKFPFDVIGFQKAVNQMSNSVSSIETKLNKFGSTMQKSVSKGIMFAAAKIGLLVKGFKSMMKNMPEIGQAFKIAGDIMSKEFFFPIRQLIMPYLQKMLDWVRDHRTLFAKWGQAVADSLKIVINVGKTLWNTLKDVVGILTNSLQKGLGTSFKSLDEFISVLQVKLAFVTLFIGDAIKALAKKIGPTFEYIIEKGAEILSFFTDLLEAWITGNDTGKNFMNIMDNLYNIFDKIVHAIGDSVASFLQGMLKPLKDLSAPLSTINDAFQRLLNLFGDGKNTGLKKVFSWLGNLVGNQLLIAFEALAVAIDTVVTGIQTLAQSGTLIKDLFMGDWNALKNDWDALKDIWKEYGNRTASAGGRMLSAKKAGIGINDGIVTKDGKVIRLNPEDNIYAFKGTPMGGITAPMSMVFNVTVTEGNAQVVGQQLGYSIHKSFVDRLKEQQMAGGW